MTIIETVLIYAGIPVLVILLVIGLVFANDLRRGGGKRYRPGRPFEFSPVWFLSALEPNVDGAAGSRAVEAAGNRPELTAGGSREAGQRPNPWPAGDQAPQTATGGASDRW